MFPLSRTKRPRRNPPPPRSSRHGPAAWRGRLRPPGRWVAGSHAQRRVGEVKLWDARLLGAVQVRFFLKAIGEQRKRAIWRNTTLAPTPPPVAVGRTMRWVTLLDYSY